MIGIGRPRWLNQFYPQWGDGSWIERARASALSKSPPRATAFARSALGAAARPTAAARHPDADHREPRAEVAPVAAPPDQATAAFDADGAGHRPMMLVTTGPITYADGVRN